MYLEDRRQQELLEKFYKEETTYFPNHVLCQFFSIFFVILSVIPNIMPLRESEGGFVITYYGYAIFAFSISFRLWRYKFYVETDNVRRSISRLLKYAPVERRQLALFSLRKIWKLCLVYTVVIIAARCGICHLTHQVMSVWDVAEPVLFSFVIPLLLVFEF